MKEIAAVVLAAGKGTRMKSDVPKVLHEIFGKPVISYVLDSLKDAGIKKIVTVTGHGNELLKPVLRSTRSVVQEKLLGSGDAVVTAKKIIGKFPGDILVICGDTPLIGAGTIKELMKIHAASGASATLLTAVLDDAGSYGRIVRSADGKVLKIVEAENASAGDKAVKEVNVGTYCFNSKELFEALSEIKPDSKKKEFFLTDVIEVLKNKGRSVEALKMKRADEMIGINTRKDLALAATILKNKVLEEVMSGGVTIEDPASTIIYPGVTIGKDTVIKPNTVIESDVKIGERCQIGPFARLRPGVRLSDNVEVGNFVELVRTEVDKGTRIKHHTYLGDTKVGKRVNIGAGNITANFDGKKKNRTIIEDGAFIGVGAILIAPVKVGKGSVVGAGCVVPKGHNVANGSTVVGVPAKVMKKKI